MKTFHSNLLFLGVAGFIFLGSSDRDSNVIASEIKAQAEIISETAGATKDSKSKKGGQVVESGAYHLELVTLKEDKGTHLDFYLQRGDSHATIPNAKVMAQIQMPDGTQKTLPFQYDTKGQHYTALLAGNKTGQYQVKVTADIKGEKVNGRFSFKQ
ncbi:MAG: hypothetical protein CLLPBCKN_001164 [Chroococcidiopsis cubana SAG 39.79]|jgi:hypothetical protein|uniref:YtkA-like domain-containing protein n=1 Tax=Chroococcidiopsis cubana SAG 39.79 TaxID=388085 RepID=A0AB37UDC2_9CYAN|nr:MULTISPECIES: hypothetical protein [Chroococcidiopsis]MDZ4871776.1 hypothetical protein [Chroococcidiopsis cubana SAG 39.79]PSB62321.1 hypothetical protein C7B79_18545 [Chroococcidiopsis cubana CCALA 043]RUT05812.1 hypothetical protein DSM107010_54470 [Chroococcidiopsis cubana SAG 39.79]URD47815.1 hypothetical protein M5J74_15870 [Chroococcidiopsis sp. CCNUC1]